MEQKNALIFPCGSECGLEIHQALQYEKYLKVFGVSSIENNPGSFVYENYIEEIVPFISADDFVDRFNDITERYEIDFVFPALDSVALFLTEHGKELRVAVVSSPYETNRICRSKQLTYEVLSKTVKVPELYSPEEVNQKLLPVFLKPDVGQGSEGTVLAKDLETIQYFTTKNQSLLVMEYLPGREYTIDCFTDRYGSLLFSEGRERRRIKAGIAVNSICVRDVRFKEWAEKINAALNFRGGWFFQVKENSSGEWVLLEVASRIAGTSALARNRGVNLPLISFYDAIELDVSILENQLENEIDRVFVNRFRLGAEFDTVYCDFDDCLVVRGKANTSLIDFLFQCFNRGKKLILLTRHADDISDSLKNYRLSELFDSVVHITDMSPKSKYITSNTALLIDDSHREREEAIRNRGIVALAPDAVVGINLG